VGDKAHILSTPRLGTKAVHCRTKLPPRPRRNAVPPTRPRETLLDDLPDRPRQKHLNTVLEHNSMDLQLYGLAQFAMQSVRQNFQVINHEWVSGC
jgi:hypothetical protein